MNVSQNAALANPQAHKFIPGQGYLPAPELRIEGDPVEGGQAAPPKGIKSGTRHWLRTPGGTARIDFEWNAKAGAWINLNSRRIGFTPDYLTHYGWTYEGPLDPPSIVDKLKAAIHA